MSKATVIQRYNKNRFHPLGLGLVMSSHLNTPLFKQITKIQDAAKETQKSHGTTHHLVNIRSGSGWISK